MQGEQHHQELDVILIGAGIMSATLGVLLKELNPRLTISIFESLAEVAAESSNAWNNAGTGHAALCELNYTPERADGSIDISKALAINEDFEISKQLWAYFVERGFIEKPGAFIHQVPHVSFVSGEKDVAFLRKRFAALGGHHLFAGMEYSEDRDELEEWMPLIVTKAGRHHPRGCHAHGHRHGRGLRSVDPFAHLTSQEPAGRLPPPPPEGHRCAA